MYIPNYTFFKKETSATMLPFTPLPQDQPKKKKKSICSPKEKNVEHNLSNLHYLVISNIQTDFQAIANLLVFMAVVQEYKFRLFENTLIPLTMNSSLTKEISHFNYRGSGCEKSIFVYFCKWKPPRTQIASAAHKCCANNRPGLAAREHH